MLSVAQIDRMTHDEAWPRLVRRVLANGRCPARAIADRLSEAGIGGMAEVAGPALALQRVCELSWAPSALTDRLAGRLAEVQRCTPSAADWRNLMRSALVVRALDDLMALSCAGGMQAAAGLQRMLAAAGDRAARSAALLVGGRAERSPGSGPRFAMGGGMDGGMAGGVAKAPGVADAGLGAAIALWQAASSPTLRAALPLPLLPDLARRVPGAAALVSDVVVSAAASSAAA